MKNSLIITIALLLVAGASGWAQSPARDRLDEIEQMTVPEAIRKIKHRTEGFDRFEVMPLSHLNVGMHSMRGEGFKTSLGPSWQIQMNMVQARFAPTSWLGLEAGWDLSWDQFRTAPGYTLAKNATDGHVILTGPDALSEGWKSRYKLFSFTFPITVHFLIGPVSLRSGVELGAPLGGRLQMNYDQEDIYHEIVVKGMDHGSFFYTFMAEVSYEGLGIYCKYCPQAFIPGLGFNYWCWGIHMGLD